MLSKLLFTRRKDGKGYELVPLQTVSHFDKCEDEYFWIKNFGLNTSCIWIEEDKPRYYRKIDICVTHVLDIEECLENDNLIVKEEYAPSNNINTVEFYDTNANFKFKDIVHFSLYVNLLKKSVFINREGNYVSVKNSKDFSLEMFSKDLKMGNITYIKNSTRHSENLYSSKYGGLTYTVDQNCSIIALHKKLYEEYDEHILQTVYKVFGLKEYLLKFKKFIPYLKFFPKDFTYGVEFETSEGFVPKELCILLGLVPLRDGSLGRNNAFEYATGIIKSYYDFQNLFVACSLLDDICSYNSNCALHVHIGNKSDTGSPNMKILATRYKIAYDLQDLLFSLVPMYKVDEITSFGKSKNYSSKLPWPSTVAPWDINSSSLETLQDDIVSYLTAYSRGYLVRNNESHSIEPWGRQWRCPTRYHHVNFINYLFTTGTIEYRLFNPTFKVEQLFNWLFITTAIHSMIDEKFLLKSKISITDLFSHLRDYFKADEKIISNFNKYFSLMQKNKIEGLKAFTGKFLGGSSQSSSFATACSVEVNAKKNDNAELFKIVP